MPVKEGYPAYSILVMEKDSIEILSNQKIDYGIVFKTTLVLTSDTTVDPLKL